METYKYEQNHFEIDQCIKRSFKMFTVIELMIIEWFQRP